MNRLLFEKTGDAVYLSHLDLMRVFQRAFKRADIMIWHSQGFSPRAYVSIALPLPVGSGRLCRPCKAPGPAEPHDARRHPSAGGV